MSNLTAAIQVRDLHFTYPAVHPRQIARPALSGVSLEVPDGQFVALLGRVGAGKSTLCLALNGLAPHATGGVFRGDVVVHELNTKRHPVAELATRVGLVFQDPESQIVHSRVDDEVAFGPENLGVAPDEIEERVAWALDATAMAEYRERSPLLLSGGEKQRVAIAAMLAMRPRVLVLDEPTASLDPAGKAAIFGLLARLSRAEGLTVFMATQEVDRAFRYADRILALDEGAIVLDGQPAELLRRPERLQSLGLGLPELAEVGQRLTAATGRSYRFHTLRGAYERLKPEVQPDASPLWLPLPTPPEAPAGPPQIEIEGLTFHYDPARRALDEVSLTINRGEFVVLMGRNGSGKTTLARHLNGLLKPVAGVVRVEGEDTRPRRVAELARHVGYVFQNPDHQIFAPTVADEVAFGLRVQGLPASIVAERVAETLERFGLTRYADLPPALLGFGQRRIVSLASVLATQPSLLILDEPTDGLDARSQAELMATIERFNAGGGTILLVTHDVRLMAEHARRVLVLDAGRLIFDGAPSGLFDRPDLLASAGLRLPLVRRLAQRLGPRGASTNVNSPAQFVAAWQTRQAPQPVATGQDI